MNSMSARALAVARPTIQILTVLNIFYAICIAVLLVATLVNPAFMERALGLDLVSKYPLVPLGLRGIVVIGIVGAAIVHAILRRLLAIVDTVRGGDPFIVENVQRLDAIAWRVVALEVLRLIVIAIAAAVWEPGRLESFSFAPWLAVLMLFVLSGVFAHGARLRADLEGTV